MSTSDSHATSAPLSPCNGPASPLHRPATPGAVAEPSVPQEHQHRRSVLLNDVETIEQARKLPIIPSPDMRGTCGYGGTYRALQIASRATVRLEEGTAIITLDARPGSTLTVSAVQHPRAYDLMRLEGPAVQELWTAKAAYHLEALYRDDKGQDVALIRGRTLHYFEEDLAAERPENPLTLLLRARSEAWMARIAYNHQHPTPRLCGWPLH